MTHNEQQFIIWVCVTLLGVIASALVLFVKAFLQMVQDINEIKTALQVHGTKHENLEKRVEHLEERIND